MKKEKVPKIVFEYKIIVTYAIMDNEKAKLTVEVNGQKLKIIETVGILNAAIEHVLRQQNNQVTP